MTGRLSCGGMGIWFLTARRRWSIRSMDMSNGEAARGNSTRRPQWTLIGWPMAITFEYERSNRMKDKAAHAVLQRDGEGVFISGQCLEFCAVTPGTFQGFVLTIL